MMAESNAKTTKVADAEISPPLVSTDKGTEIKSSTTADSQAAKQPSRRRSVVGNENTREIQRQQRVNKSERKLKFDGRHSFVFGKLADALDLDSAVVEDHILSDSRFELMDQFFMARGSKKLMFFYQEITEKKSHASASNKQKKLFITPGTSEGLNGVCLFFLRTATDKNLTSENIAAEVLFMWMDCSGGKVIEGFESMMNKVLVPVLKSQKSWGTTTTTTTTTHNEQQSDLLELLDKFTDTLVAAKDNMTQHLMLAETEFDLQLESMHTLQDYRTASCSNEFVRSLEGVLIVWYQQIEQVLTESEQIRREADNVGPNAELQYWKARMAKFNTLMEHKEQSM